MVIQARFWLFLVHMTVTGLCVSPVDCGSLEDQGLVQTSWEAQHRAWPRIGVCDGRSLSFFLHAKASTCPLRTLQLLKLLYKMLFSPLVKRKTWPLQDKMTFHPLTP